MRLYAPYRGEVLDVRLPSLARAEHRAELPDRSRPVFVHEFVPGADAVVISTDRFEPTELAVVTWNAG